MPCVRPAPDGRPLHALNGRPRRPAPYLAHAAGTGLDGVLERAFQQMPQGPCLERVFASDSPETLKAMALAGQGIAFLPERCVETELACARLVPAGPAIDVPLDIFILRTRLPPRSAGKPLLEDFWARLKAQAVSPAWQNPPAAARRELTEAT